MMGTDSGNQTLRSGYDLPIIGLTNGYFDQIHITALCCIIVTVICGIAIIYLSFRDNKEQKRTFFHWRQIERFVVYMAICDTLFGIFHGCDHLHTLITRNYPRPKEMCEFYAFGTIEFVCAQSLLVAIVAINMFVLIWFNKKINLGKYDWKLLAWMFGYPLVLSSFALSQGYLGPGGAL